MSNELSDRKIQPRNLTARADALVRGNSVATRPESGVENCYPGLEFDQRNLDKRFFPGLVFEYHAEVQGTFLRAVDPIASGESANITPDDLTAGVFLWAIYGTHGRLQNDRRDYALDVTSLMSGLDVWRIVHDLEPGPVALLLGQQRAGGAPLALDELAEFQQASLAGEEKIARDASGRIQYAVVVGQRRRYLDAEGVIDPEAFEPGDLTRSLCAPWQYDFRDCGCFYWASNKPDLVAVKPGAPQIANFQRSPSAPEPTQPVRNYAQWTRDEYSYTQMIHQWEALSTVVDRVETARYELSVPPALPPGEILPRAEAIRRLRYLATVEHGLMVEYLYAQYSLKADAVRPTVPGPAQQLHDARRVLLSVAIDEMRHLRWINEILRELGEAPELGRFTSLEDFDNDPRTLKHDFSLEPLSAARLRWFIAVEEPSQALSVARDPGTIDGLYTRLLLSISQSQEFAAEKTRLEHLLKLVIDEGQDHFSRFTRVQAMLADLDEADYLQLPANPAPLEEGHDAKRYEKIADDCYELVLSTLGFVFETGGVKLSEMLNAARHAMYALDDAARAVTREGGAPLFSLPPAAPAAQAAARRHGVVDSPVFAGRLTPSFEQRIAPKVQDVLEASKTVNNEAFYATLSARYATLVQAMKAASE